MFLKKLYRHNKTLFLLFTAYLCAFLYINYKWGVIATPVLQFGMYSGKYRLQDTITVYRVVANNRLIDPSLISAGQDDFIQTYLGLYPAYQENNRLVNKTFHSYLGFLPGGGIPAERLVMDEAFTKWFKQNMQAIVAEPIQKLEANRQHFVWIHKRLVPIDTASKLDFLDAN